MFRLLRYAIAAFLFSGVAYAGAPGVINQYNALCDPNFPTRCAAPDASGNLPVTGTFSATLSGFAPNGNYATLSASGVSSNVALPSGTVVLVQNVGTNTAYVNLGTTNAVTATTSQIAVPASSWIAFTVGSNTYLAGITASSTTTLTLAGGSGLATGAGGGSSGGGGGTSSSFSAAFPATGTAVGASNGTNMLPLLVNGSGYLEVVLPSASAVTQSGTWTVQPGNTANTAPWLFTVNQGGNSATVSAAGALKVDGSGSTQPVSGTVTANQGTSPWVSNVTQFGSSNVATGTGASGAGIPRVTVSNDSYLADTTATGSITTTQNVAITTSGQTSVGIAITGSFTGTLVFEASVDGTNWVPTSAVQIANGTISSSTTGPFSGQANVGGLAGFRVRGNTVSVGTASVTLRAGVGSSTVMADNPFPVTQSGTWTVQPGNTANTTPWLMTQIPSAASAAAITPVVSASVEASHVLKASAGNLYGLSATTSLTSAWYLLLYNATSAPADGAVTPIKCYAVPAGSQSLAASWGSIPARFSTGIVAVLSTTGCFTQTASATGFISGEVQ